MNKTIVIGLDAACLDVITPWMEKGELPNLRRLMASGTYSELESIIPALTAPAWTSIATGKNPGKHGIFHFVKKKAGGHETELVTSSDVQARYIWEYLSEAGMTSVVINMPLTHPPREMKGVLIPGILAPADPTCFPAGAIKDYEEAHGKYRVYSDCEFGHAAPRKRLKGYLDVTKMGKKAALFFAQKMSWDLLVVQFQKTDDAIHHFGLSNLALELYRCVDTCIGEILDAIGENANVIVISDHGIGSAKWDFQINSWLRQEGLLKACRSGAVPLHATLAESIVMGQRRKAGFSERLFKYLGKKGITLEEVQRVVDALRLGFLLRLIPALKTLKVTGRQIDWENSEAYCDPATYFGITINRGGENRGRVDDGEEYRALREHIIERLKGLRDPDGEPVFAKVLRREEYYTGPETVRTPDIVFSTIDSRCQTRDILLSKLFTPGRRQAHTSDGLLITCGPDIQEGQRLSSKPSILDIAPTVLHMMGVPVPEDMDGRVLKEIFRAGSEPATREKTSQRVRAVSNGSCAGHERQTESPVIAAEDQENIRKRLRALGYIE